MPRLARQMPQEPPNPAEATPTGADARRAAGRVLAVALPLPGHDLTANGRLHWAARAALVRETRRQAAILARQAMLDAGWRGWRVGMGERDLTFFPRGTRVRVDYAAVLPPGRRRWDDTALIEAAKPCIDGLTDAGVWAGDACAVVGTVTWDRDRALSPAASGLLLLTLTDVLGGAPGGRE